MAAMGEALTNVDKTYRGHAVYVGDGIWRFYVGIEWYDVPTEEVSYDERVVQAHSLPDRTWQDMCDPNSWQRDYQAEEDQFYEDMSK